jgi:uncharacterized GH25 family protein
MPKLLHRSLAAGIVFGMSALAHYTWIAPVTLPLQVGKTAIVKISHGHKFPASEEAIDARQVDLFVLTPSGGKVALKPSVAGSELTAQFAVKEPGAHRIVLVQDRGITSRTPSGVKPGGRDKNPNATQVSRSFRTAIAYASTTKETRAPKPANVDFELAGEHSNGAWKLQLLKQGKPAPDVPVEVFLSGSSSAVRAGKTGPDGRISYQPPAGSSGPAMFSATLKENPPPGAAYDSVNYSTSLYVSW